MTQELGKLSTNVELKREEGGEPRKEEEPDIVDIVNFVLDQQNMKIKRLEDIVNNLSLKLENFENGKSSPISKNDFTKELYQIIPMFTGSGDTSTLLEFVDKWDSYITMVNLDYETIIKIFPLKLTGGAMNWWRSLKAEIPPSWISLKEQLKKEFISPNHEDEIRTLLQQLQQGNMTVKDYIQKFNKYRIQLTSLGKEEEKSYFMNGLKDDIRKSIKINIDNLKDLQSMQAAARRIDSDTTPNDTDQTKAFVNVSTPKKTKDPEFFKNIPCHCCDQLGHGFRKCPKIMDKMKKWRSNSKKDGSTALLTQQHANETQSWVLDCGATKHMSPDIKWFTTYSNFNQNVVVGNGDRLDVVGYGTVLLKLSDEFTMELHNVWHVPNLTHNLISIQSLGDLYTVNLKGNHIKILYDDNIVFENIVSSSSLYEVRSIDNVSLVIKPESPELWHKRLGHLNYTSLKEISKLADGIKLEDGVTNNQCEACIYGKHHRSSHSSSNNKTTEPLQLVHSDLCGPFNVESLGGHRYFLTFIDDSTHYTWIYLLKQKSEVVAKFTEFIAKVELESGYQLKTLRTDGGREYLGLLDEILKKKGIKHETTTPYTPEQNGKSERMNRTLCESMRAMLYDSKLPLCLWGEAGVTAAYIRNRCPTIALKILLPLKHGIRNVLIYQIYEYLDVWHIVTYLKKRGRNWNQRPRNVGLLDILKVKKDGDYLTQQTGKLLLVVMLYLKSLKLKKLFSRQL